jgi:hypothetical protein
MDNRKDPEQTPCEQCGGEIYQSLLQAPTLVSDSKSMHRRAGSEFNDRMKQIKKGSGRSNTIKTI